MQELEPLEQKRFMGGKKMSKDYREKTGIDIEATTTPEMREFCQRPGKKDEDGNLIYMTEQHFKDTCDVNKIIRKYDKTGLINHVNEVEAKYGDMTGLDYKAAMDLVVKIGQEFEQFPSHIRNRFRNSPEKYLEFMENPENREEAIKLGLVRADVLEELDGLGEHVITDKDGKKVVATEE